MKTIQTLQVTHSETLKTHEIKDFKYNPTNLINYRHKKGGIYTKYGVIMLHGEMVVLYQSEETKEFWVRPFAMFYSKEEVECKVINRFERVEN